MKDQEKSQRPATTLLIELCDRFQSLSPAVQQVLVICTTIALVAMFSSIPSCMATIEEHQTNRHRMNLEDTQHWRDTWNDRKQQSGRENWGH